LWPPLFQRCGEKGGTAHCDYSELEVCFETDYAKGMAPPLQRTPFAKLKCELKFCLLWPSQLFNGFDSYS
jgi:hypothetical protein